MLMLAFSLHQVYEFELISPTPTPTINLQRLYIYYVTWILFFLKNKIIIKNYMIKQFQPIHFIIINEENNMLEKASRRTNKQRKV